MQELRAVEPVETNEGPDLVRRLMDRLLKEGFTTDLSLDDWMTTGEIIFRRDEKISIATGETIFIFTAVSDLNERILRQSSEAVVNTYKAKSISEKALSVLQTTTVYHCLVCTTDQPHGELLNEYITRSGGATFIPVVMVPEINQVIYPNLEEERLGTVRPRVEYLQYLLGERREMVNMHAPTIQAFYVSVAVVVMLVVAVLFSFVR